MSKVLHKKFVLADSRLLSVLPQQFSRAVYFENGQELFVGLGAVRILGVKNNLRETVKQAESFFAENQEWRQGRFFGGVSFDGKCPDFWTDFGSAAFVFPRLQIIRQAEGFEALLFVPTNDAENDFWLKIWDKLEENLNQNSLLLAEFTSSQIFESQKNHLLVEKSFPDKKGWEKYILQILADIQSGKAEKIVPARQVLLEFHDTVSLTKTLFRLRAFLPSCTVFVFKTDSLSFVGATPETLIRKQGVELKSEALAGTMPFDCNRTLFLANEKECREHNCVLQHIMARLMPFCSEISAPSEPQLRELSHLVHLCSPIFARLQDKLHILRLAEVLHPTPAVCGLPVSFAKKRISELENLARGWYSGFFGWFDAWGNGDFRVALRCALLHKNTARLYAGAGIVQGSNADKEFLETETKLQAMRSILG